MDEYNRRDVPQQNTSVFVVSVVTSILTLATTGATAFFAIRGERKLNNAIAETKDALASNKQWTDVADHAISSVPAVIEGLSRLLVGTMDLLQFVKRSGGMAQFMQDKKPKESYNLASNSPSIRPQRRQNNEQLASPDSEERDQTPSGD